MDRSKQESGITAISVEGFKSIARRRRIEIRPLTILAGANSSGKSSIMQPLLLMKQTLDSTYDPGPLLLDGPNVRFTSVDQFLSRSAKSHKIRTLSVAIESRDVLANHSVQFRFSSPEGRPLEVRRLDYATTSCAEESEQAYHITRGMKSAKLHEVVRTMIPEFYRVYKEHPLEVATNRFFLEVAVNPGSVTIPSQCSLSVRRHIQGVIHVPGLRGSRERVYRKFAPAPEHEFPDTFENYIASLVASWQEEGNGEIQQLGSMFSELGLTSGILATGINDVQAELRVSRMLGPRQPRPDLVDIADVGFGVSQVLPVLVALLASERGQLVYIEQPELHLHPRAQHALAKILVDAANRGIRLVIETHSSLLLIQIQTLVAKGYIDPELVRLHWFSRDREGVTSIDSADMDENGAFGEWPVDFGDVELEAHGAYIDTMDKELEG